MDRIRSDPFLSHEAISIDAINGNAILRGTVSGYAVLVAACAAAKDVKAVVAVRSELTVQIPEHLRRTDAEIRGAAIAALRWRACLPPGAVNVCVLDGRVTLTGRVDWSYQKKLAEEVIVSLQGITSIDNMIEVSDRQIEMEVLTRIRAALRVAAEAQADAIEAEVLHGTVTLRGILQSIGARATVCAAARGHPEVRQLYDELRLAP